MQTLVIYLFKLSTSRCRYICVLVVTLLLLIMHRMTTNKIAHRYKIDLQGASFTVLERLARSRTVLWNDIYTAKNATDLMQVVHFTGLMQVANKLYQACWFHQVTSSLWTSDLLQLDICRLAASWWNNLHQTCMQSATCSKSANNL